jgi:hypothetical protein
METAKQESNKARAFFPCHLVTLSPCHLVTLSFALAALLRLGVLHTEFWFDEIWSWEFARAAASPWQIFTGEGQHHDNNHKLNTLCLWFWPAGVNWGWYRLHSFVAGLATVAVAALIAHRRGRAEAVFAALLFAVNYWLVLYSTEARGYALAVCFALLALYTLQGYLTNGRRRMLVLFWISVLLGFLAHLTFFHCYAALVLWSVHVEARRRVSRRAELRRLLACHVPPGLFLLGFYVVDVRRMQFGGAPPLPASLVLERLIGLGLGGGASTIGSLAPILLAILAFGYGLRMLAREEHHLGLFFAAVIVGSPVLFLLRKPDFLFERYFLISFAFFLLLLSYVLGALWRSSRWGAGAAVVLTLAIVAGNLRHLAAFERGGRGHFLDALAYLERSSPPGEVSVAGDYDFRVHKLYRFYLPYIAKEERFHYCEQTALPPHGADWLLVHRLSDDSPLSEQIVAKDGNVYERVQDFPADAFAGWSWHVYRNVNASLPARSASKGRPCGRCGLAKTSN